MTAIRTAPAVAVAYHDLHNCWPAEAAGLVQLRRTRATGTLSGVYDADEAGIESYGYATVCEDHGTLVIHDTLALAKHHAPDPLSWCGPCRGEDDEL